MLACIEVAAAAICPSMWATAAGYGPVVELEARRSSTGVHAPVKRTNTPRTGRPSKQNLCNSDMLATDLAQPGAKPLGVAHVGWSALRSKSACCSGVSMRTTLAGLPSSMAPSGNSLPSVTSAPAPTRLALPILAPLSTTAPMPISEPSPTVQPCSMTWCPTVTSLPTCKGMPWSACNTLPSWMLLPLPTAISSVSPRRVAPNQTLASAASSTLPITCALSATQAVAATRGATPSSSVNCHTVSRSCVRAL